MQVLREPPFSVHSDVSSSGDAFPLTPTDLAWLAGHAAGIAGVESGPPGHLPPDEASAWRRGQLAGLDDD